MSVVLSCVVVEFGAGGSDAVEADLMVEAEGLTEREKVTWRFGRGARRAVDEELSVDRRGGGEVVW